MVAYSDIRHSTTSYLVPAVRADRVRVEHARNTSTGARAPAAELRVPSLPLEQQQDAASSH